jgi:hypothetical protein
MKQYKLLPIALLLVALAAVVLVVRTILLPMIITLAALLVSFVVFVRTTGDLVRGHRFASSRRERFLAMLLSLMAVFLCSGTLEYLCAFAVMRDGGSYVSAEYLVRSVGLSLNLFALSIDYDMNAAIASHGLLKGIIALQAVLSFACTVGLVLGLVYFRLGAYLKFRFGTRVDERHGHVYLFFGLNAASEPLMRSIREAEGPRAVIVLVETTQMDEEGVNGWDSIMGMLTNRRQVFASIADVDAAVTFTQTLPSGLNMDEGEGMHDLFGEMNIPGCKRILCQLARLPMGSDRQVHLFFMGDEADENLNAAVVMARDATLVALAERGVPCRFYCHGDGNRLSHALGQGMLRRGFDVQVVDDARLAVDSIKGKPEYHPVRLVELSKDNPTTVSLPFEALIVGFNAVGREALGYLYEFGAFSDSRSTPDTSFRSRFHCAVFDPDMDDAGTAYAITHPAVMAARNRDGSPLVEMMADGHHGKAFYDYVERVAQRLNYVMVCLDNGREAMDCAVGLFLFLLRHRGNHLDRLKIFVYAHNADDMAYLSEVVRHYNEGYACDSQTATAILIPFGSAESIYTYDIVVTDRLRRQGKLFQKNYTRLRGGISWDERHRRLSGLKQRMADGSWQEVPLAERRVSLASLSELRRKETQDMANALHAGTKLYLLRQALGDDDWPSFVARYFSPETGMAMIEGRMADIRYPRLDDWENTVVRNLAQLEHHRWVASHEVLGYRHEEGAHLCDETTRVHNCLIPWQALDEESMAQQASGWTDADYKLYDYGVVDTTIRIYFSNPQN